MNHPHTLLKKTTSFGLCCMILLTLGACSSAPTAVDQHFGAAVRQAQQKQTRYSESAHCPAHGTCLAHERGHMHAQASDSDGVTAKSAIDRYQKSFETPAFAPSAPIFNFGFGGAQNAAPTR